MDSQNVQGVLHIVAMAEHAASDAARGVVGQLVRFVIEHVITALVFKHDVHETREQTIQLLRLQTGTRLSWLHHLANQTIHVLCGEAMRFECKAHFGPGVVTIELRQAQTMLL